MKKKFQKALQPGQTWFYLLFLLFAAGGLYFSLWYGAAGIAVCGILRLASLRQESERKRQVQDLMGNIEVSGGEIKPAVTHSPLPTVVALATTGEIVWANEAFAEISGQFSGARPVSYTHLDVYKRQGDTLARELFEEYCVNLSCGLANLVNIFQPECIVIGGGLAGYGEKLIEPLRRLTEAETFQGASCNARIIAAALGNDAGLIGAAML